MGMMPTPAIARQTLQEARPLVRRALSNHRFIAESVKGCNPSLSPSPLPISPPLDPGLRQDGWLSLSRGSTGSDSCPASHRPRIWFNLAVHPDHKPRDRDSESFIRQLSAAKRGWIFEVAGNRCRIDIRIGIDQKDVPVLKAAMLQLQTPLGDGLCRKDRFRDGVPAVAELVPRPPYIDPFTRLDELPHPPVGLIVELLADLHEDYLGLYQVCAAPVRDDRWLDNAKVLYDALFRSGLEPSGPDGTPTLSWTQQVPSVNISRLTQDTYTKIHPDRAYCFALCRCALWSPDWMNGTGVNEDVAAQLECLVAPLGLIRQAGRSMDVIPPDQIAAQLTPQQIVSMITQGRVHRHGMLMNTEELAAFAHMPPLRVIESYRLDNLRCEPLVQEEFDIQGTGLENWHVDAKRSRATIPRSLRCEHAHLIGRTGSGKSTLLTSMLLDDVGRGDGAMVIDPHGNLARDLADRLPEDVAKRCWWLDFNDPDRVVLYNPLRAGGLSDLPAEVADDFIGGFQDMTSGWGDRLEHLNRNIITAVAELPDTSLLDAMLALERKSTHGEQTRRRLIEGCSDALVRRFFKDRFDAYSNADLNPAHHKFSKLLQSGNASLSLRQPINRLDISSWMARGDVVLVNLGSLSREFKHILGSFLIANVFTAAQSRGDVSGDSVPPFHLYIDECHRFSCGLQARMVAEVRKNKVSLTMAHQHMHQFERSYAHAFGTVGTSIVFQVDKDDADAMARAFQGRIEGKQIMSLDRFRAYARIGNEVVSLHTPRYTDLPRGAGRFEEIRDRSMNELYDSRTSIMAWTNKLIEGEIDNASSLSTHVPSEPGTRLPDDPDWPN